MHENWIPRNSGTRTWVFIVIVAKETAEISYQESIFMPCSSLSLTFGRFFAVRLVKHPDRFSRDAVESPSMEIIKSHPDTVLPAWPCSGRGLDQMISTDSCQPQQFPSSVSALTWNSWVGAEVSSQLRSQTSSTQASYWNVPPVSQWRMLQYTSLLRIKSLKQPQFRIRGQRPHGFSWISDPKVCTYKSPPVGRTPRD